LRKNKIGIGIQFLGLNIAGEYATNTFKILNHSENRNTISRLDAHYP